MFHTPTYSGPSQAYISEQQAKINRLTAQLALARRAKDKHRIREIEKQIADLKRSIY